MTERQPETAEMYRLNESLQEGFEREATARYCAHLSCIADIYGGDAGMDMVDGMMAELSDPLFCRQYVADAWPEFAAWKKAYDESRERVRAESKKAVA